MHTYCSICKGHFSPESTVIATECGHLCHSACFEKRFETMKTCAKCGVKIVKNRIRKIFFEIKEEDYEGMKSALERAELLIKGIFGGTSTMILKLEKAPFAISQLCTVAEALIEQNIKKTKELQQMNREKYADKKQIEDLILMNKLLEEQLKYNKKISKKRSNDDNEKTPDSTASLVKKLKVNDTKLCRSSGERISESSDSDSDDSGSSSSSSSDSDSG